MDQSQCEDMCIPEKILMNTMKKKIHAFLEEIGYEFYGDMDDSAFDTSTMSPRELQELSEELSEMQVLLDIVAEAAEDVFAEVADEIDERLSEINRAMLQKAKEMESYGEPIEMEIPKDTSFMDHE